VCRFFGKITQVPEVFLDFSSFCQAVNSKLWGGGREGPLVALDLNLTFMQTPAVKHVKLIITKGTNANLAITCLSAAYVSTRVEQRGISGGEEWYHVTYLAGVNAHVCKNFFICTDL